VKDCCPVAQLAVNRGSVAIDIEEMQMACDEGETVQQHLSFVLGIDRALLRDLTIVYDSAAGEWPDDEAEKIGGIERMIAVLDEKLKRR
jgi:hypothetical protein